MSFLWCVMILGVLCLNESPSEKEGKSPGVIVSAGHLAARASMKVPPKRKGNRQG